MRVVLDTNTISYYLRGDSEVVTQMQALRPVEVGVPAIVEYELRYGLARLPPAAARPRLNALLTLLAPMQILPFDSECAVEASTIRAALEVKGTPIGPNDILIAATAIRHKVPLVSRNVRELARVPGLTCLNWHADPVALKTKKPYASARRKS
jgi:tRNA(fMet)-specific endonuclease VapC